MRCTFNLLAESIRREGPLSKTKTRNKRGEGCFGINGIWYDGHPTGIVKTIVPESVDSWS